MWLVGVVSRRWVWRGVPWDPDTGNARVTHRARALDMEAAATGV